MSAVDTEAIVERALGCWRHVASGSIGTELYVRVSERRRIERTVIRNAHDAGVAVRAFRDGQDTAGFAACVGFSEEAVAWAAREARSYAQPALPRTPASVHAAERRSDHDPALELPQPGELQGWAAEADLEWLEAGVTNEVLIGPAGWVATRRRNRIWARTLAEPQRLVARRVTTKWALGLGEVPDFEINAASKKVALLPDASAPIVSFLVERCGQKLPSAWTITDEPSHPAGLVGGIVDDSGFPSGAVTLIHAGMAAEVFTGAYRHSFRDPPKLGPSNLVLHATDNQDRIRVGAVVSRSRVLPLGPDDWVVELDLADGSSIYVRSSPAELAERLVATFGSSRATADGPIVRGIVLDTQTSSGQHA